MRHIPTFTENLARYVFAMNYCTRKNVIDLGCEDGHGTSLLSYAAAKITAVDISATNLSKAPQRYNFHRPIEFIQCDFEKDFPEGTWEVATCFEVIEHLKNPDFFVENVSKHLVHGGKFIFSVPHMVANRFHKVLFDEQKIKELISSHLQLDEFYFQNEQIISGKPVYKGILTYIGVATKT